MSKSEIITIIMTSVGGSAILFAALAWVTKSIINHFLSKDIEKFKHRLENKSQKEMMHLQSSLQQYVFEHQVLFSKLHERRANIMAEIYGKLYEFYWAACAFLKHYHSSDNTKKTALLTKLEKEGDEFKDFFDKHRIYFNEETCSLIDKLVDSLNEAYIPLGMYVEENSPTNREKSHEREVWRKGADIMMKRVPMIISSLESSFRQILGVNQAERDDDSQTSLKEPRVKASH